MVKSSRGLRARDISDLKRAMFVSEGAKTPPKKPTQLQIRKRKREGVLDRVLTRIKPLRG